MPYNYVSSDGKRKATLADAFIAREDAAPGLASAASDSEERSSQPWNMGWQVSERNLVWNHEIASQLIRRVTAAQLDCTEEELEKRVVDLVAVLPGLTQKMHTMKAGVLAKLAEDPAATADKLLQLKTVFPTGNVQQMVLRDMRLLLEHSVEDIGKAAAALRDILPEDVNIDRLCEQHPSMLEVESFKAALEEVRRLMPKLDISHALQAQPEIIFSTQRTKSMIPYDPVPGSSH